MSLAGGAARGPERSGFGIFRSESCKGLGPALPSGPGAATPWELASGRPGRGIQGCRSARRCPCYGPQGTVTQDNVEGPARPHSLMRLWPASPARCSLGSWPPLGPIAGLWVGAHTQEVCDRLGEGRELCPRPSGQKPG